MDCNENESAIATRMRTKRANRRRRARELTVAVHASRLQQQISRANCPTGMCKGKGGIIETALAAAVTVARCWTTGTSCADCRTPKEECSSEQPQRRRRQQSSSPAFAVRPKQRLQMRKPQSLNVQKRVSKTILGAAETRSSVCAAQAGADLLMPSIALANNSQPTLALHKLQATTLIDASLQAVVPGRNRSTS